MSNTDNPPDHTKTGLTQLRVEISDGLQYTHDRANANTAKLLEVTAFTYAAIELLAAKGIISIEELDERKKIVAGRLMEKFADQGMGVARQEPELGDKYAFQGAVEIDCENRVHLCKAACCRMRFALSKQDVDEGIVRWDFGHPYLIARGFDGYCIHMDRDQRNCSIHSQHPAPCRAYDCRNDKRIWADFDNKVVSSELEQLFRSPGGLHTDDDGNAQ